MAQATYTPTRKTAFAAYARLVWLQGEQALQEKEAKHGPLFVEVVDYDDPNPMCETSREVVAASNQYFRDEARTLARNGRLVGATLSGFGRSTSTLVDATGNCV